jgi:hypothetical protein
MNRPTRNIGGRLEGSGRAGGDVTERMRLPKGISLAEAVVFG